MKDDCIFGSTPARGKLIDQPASSKNWKKDVFAYLDVTDPEPLNG
jgi:phosphoglycerate dehydrogenase-like enzyme